MSAFVLERVDRIAVLMFDTPGETVNTLSRTAGMELRDRLAAVQADRAVDAVVLVSRKAEGFIAGADVHELAAITSAADAAGLSKEGQSLMDAVAASTKPIVAAIHGACLGGGLELALASHYRLASDADATRLGLPEVHLGLIPAAGGCQRLPRLVGLRSALDLILTGRALRAPRARRAGLVDEVVPASILRRVAVEAAARLAGGWRPPRAAPSGLAALLLDRNAIGRRLVLHLAARGVRKKAAGHYPAAAAAIDAVRWGLTRGMAGGLARESELFGQLVVGNVSRRLIEIFFANTSLKKDVGVDLEAPGVRAVGRLGVVGAGFMGAAIAGVAALEAGVDTRLRDTDGARVARGILGARAVLDEARTRRRLDPYEHARRTALLSGTTDYSGFGRRDLVIEAVFEDLSVKRGIVAELESAVGHTCVVASNTSTLPIGRLQEAARVPERVVGMHFFSPVQRMPLLEVVRGPATADWAVATAVAFGRQMGKTAIVVQDAPGFWVNRILAPYLNEAGWLLEEGVSIERVDRIMTAFGFPVGPFTLLDEVGLDVAAKASAVLHEAHGDRLAPPRAVAALVAQGRLGRKSGAGFYRYHRGRRRRNRSVAATLGGRATTSWSDAEIERRLLLAILNEAARAFGEGVVGSPRDGDLGALFGFGFPAYLGGPLRCIDEAGATAIVTEIERLAAKVGPRFAPAETLTGMASRGGRFHGDGA